MKRFIECLLPVTACNLQCSYCYVVQQERRSNDLPQFDYPIEHIAKALSKERLGGVSYISICGAGETLIPKEIVPLTSLLLEEGHYVNLTNNGTITSRLDELLALPKELLGRLHFAFSFHYDELIKKNLLTTFSENIEKVRRSPCSFLVQLNLVDEYVPQMDEIADFSREHFGALPHIALTRDEFARPDYKILTNYTRDEYQDIGMRFNSNLFRATMQNFKIPRQEFCYAGEWSGTLNLSTGVMSKCYNSATTQNIFKDLDEPIEFEAIGRNCPSPYCLNSSHFMALGIIPRADTPTYAALRDRPEAGWYKEPMKSFLNNKFVDDNPIYGFVRRYKADMKEYTLRNNSKKGCFISKFKKFLGMGRKI